MSVYGISTTSASDRDKPVLSSARPTTTSAVVLHRRRPDAPPCRSAVVADLSAVDQLLAHEEKVARGAGGAVGHHLDVDAAGDRVVQPDAGRAATNLDLVRRQRGHHAPAGVEPLELRLDAHVLEVTALLGEVEHHVRRIGPDPDGHLSPAAARPRRQGARLVAGRAHRLRLPA